MQCALPASPVLLLISVSLTLHRSDSSDVLLSCCISGLAELYSVTLGLILRVNEQLFPMGICVFFCNVLRTPCCVPRMEMDISGFLQYGVQPTAKGISPVYAMRAVSSFDRTGSQEE